MGARDGTQVLRHGCRSLYPLTLLSILKQIGRDPLQNNTQKMKIYYKISISQPVGSMSFSQGLPSEYQIFTIDNSSKLTVMK